MAGNAAEERKGRLRADLKEALKHGLKAEVSLIRALLAAIDNAEAPPRTDEELRAMRHDNAKACEIERLDLSSEQLDRLLAGECDARAEAATGLDRRGQSDMADALRAEAAAIRRYLG